MKTGGLVVWCKKDVLVVYRGQNQRLTSNGRKVSSSTVNNLTSDNNTTMSQEKSNASTWGRSLYGEDRDENNQPVVGSLYERETDRLLDGLGPRFIDWWMRKPLPVDADLLPEVVPGFRPPTRLSPPKTRPKLTDEELTNLRKLAHPLPFHFALGITLPIINLSARTYTQICMVYVQYFRLMAYACSILTILSNYHGQ